MTGKCLRRPVAHTGIHLRQYIVSLRSAVGRLFKINVGPILGSKYPVARKRAMEVEGRGSKTGKEVGVAHLHTETMRRKAKTVNRTGGCEEGRRG